MLILGVTDSEGVWVIVTVEDIEDEEDQVIESTPEIEIENANPAPIGDPEKNDINWPVEKSLWSGVFTTNKLN